MRCWHLIIILFLVLSLFSRDDALCRAAQVGYMGMVLLVAFAVMMALAIGLGSSSATGDGRDLVVVVWQAFRTALGYPEVLTSIVCRVCGYQRLSVYATEDAVALREALIPLAAEWLLSLAPLTRKWRFDGELAPDTPAVIGRMEMEEKSMADDDDQAPRHGSWVWLNEASMIL